MAKVPTGLLSGITLALILWFTLAPHPTGELEIPLFPGADKIIHAIMFGFLTFVVLVETMKYLKWRAVPLSGIGVVAFICAGIGVIVEILQRAMGLGRSFEILDILADSAGAMIGAAVWAMIQNIFASPDD